MTLTQYLDSLIRCPSLEALWDAHTQKMAEYGFDRLIYGFTRYRTPTSLGDPEDFVILTNHSREFTEEFIGKGLYADGPMVQWALANDGACSWALMQDMAGAVTLPPAAQRVLAFNKRMDVVAGYTISFKSISARSKGAIALTAKSGMDQQAVDELWREHGADFQLMNDITHLKIHTLPQTTAKRTLTARQREALQWVGDGKTTQDIALLMGLTTATIEKHLRLARQSLGVETTAQAVLKAAFTNQMFVLEA
jgi:LuxR family transcriptional regulator